MKILQVCPRYDPQSGGVETHVKELSERLADRGHDLEVHTADAGVGGERRERRGGVRVHRHRGLAPGGAFHIAPGIYRAVRRTDAEVVHSHNYHSLPMLFAALATRDAGFIVTPHYHGASASAWRNRLLKMYRPLGGRSIRRADGVIAVSEWEAAQLSADFGVDATVIPNGIDGRRFADAVPEHRDRPFLVMVGRLKAYKDVQSAIEALDELEEFELVIAGEGPFRPRLERCVRMAGVEHRVTFLGHVDDDRLASLYAGAEVHLALSPLEAYGMTVGEALAAGTPCVVRTERALTEWVDYDGVIGVEDPVPATVRAAVTRARGVSVDADLPTWNDVTEAVLDVYRSGGRVA